MLDVAYGPLAGVPGELAGRAYDATRASAHLRDARTSARQVHAALTGQRSTAVVAAAQRLASVAERLVACSTALDGAAAILRRHAEALAGLQSDARLAAADRDAALVRERRWQAEVDDARRSTWNVVTLGTAPPVPGAPGFGAGLGAGFGTMGTTALPAATPGDDPHLRLMTAERQLAAARADVAAAEARWRAARDAKSAASRQAAAGLGAFTDVRAVGVAAAAGMSAAQYRESAAHGRRAAALLPRAALADQPADRREARADLRALLSGHRDDPAFWATFWDQATPQQVYLALGPDPADPGPVSDALHGTLAAGVAHWAQTASPAERRDLGHAAVADIGDANLGLTLRSELAATLLAGDLPAEVYAGAGDALDQRWAAHDGDPDDLTLTAPLSVAVLAGFARHRHLAFERLAPENDQRLARSARHWFGAVPRGGWPDGGTALANAFAAAVETGAASPWRHEQQRAALLVSHATVEMPRGLLSGPTPSDAASARIAHAYEPYVSSMGDAAQAQTEDACVDSSLATAPQPPPPPGVDPDPELAAGTGLAPPVVQPELDAFALRDVIAATSRTPDAAEMWLGSTDRHAAAMVDVATSGDHDVNHAPRNSLVLDAMSDVGAVTGSMQAETLDEAYATVETRETLISLTGIGLGVGAIGRTVSTSLATTAASAGLSFLDMRAPIAEAQAAVSSVEEQTYQRYATTMHDLVLAHDLDIGVPPDQAWENTEALDPMDPKNDIRAPFEQAFDKLSETDDEECE